MSERKVLNKYYPPEFDPSKIPKLKQGKNRTFSIRIMAPFNMRCDTCGEYIYKGKKFNSRKENVDDEFYLGLRIFRFYIKCPRCVAEIAFKTDLANTDYALEAGATRLFEAEKLAHQMAEKERKEKEEDELNPMKVLENRTKASRNEMDQLDQLEELKEINARHARVDHESMLEKHMAFEEQLLKLQEEEEDKLVQSILKGGSRNQVIRRIEDNSDEEEEGSSAKKAKKEATKAHSSKPTDVLTEPPKVTTEDKKPPPGKLSVGNLSTKSSLAGLVRKKAPADTKKQSTALSSSSQQSTSDTAGSELKSGHKETGQNGPSSSVVEHGNNDETKKTASSGVSSLSLLGNYSDSETGTESD